MSEKSGYPGDQYPPQGQGYPSAPPPGQGYPSAPPPYAQAVNPQQGQYYHCNFSLTHYYLHVYRTTFA